jgi:hypothetical protein
MSDRTRHRSLCNLFPPGFWTKVATLVLATVLAFTFALPLLLVGIPGKIESPR